MKKDLENLFDNLKGSLDTEIPNDGHSDRFLKKLKASRTEVKSASKRKPWMRTLAIAASVVILFGIGFMTLKPELTVQEQLAEISPEAANTELYFARLIEEQVQELQEESTPETKRMVDDTMSQLQKLKINYQTLEKNLLEGGNSKMLLSAMITNFQTRIDLIQEVLDKIETIKNLKQSNDEIYTI